MGRDPRFSVSPVAAGIERVFFVDDHPMHSGGVANYLVGAGEAVALVDTGTGDRAHTNALLDYLEDTGRELRLILLTHGHGDHTSGVPGLLERTDARVAAHPAVRHRLGDRIDDSVFDPLEDGQTIVAGGLRIDVAFIPGHSADSLAFTVRGGASFSGDTVLGRGTTSVIDLGAYMASLERLRRTPMTVMLPGHGPVIDRPARKLDEYIRHRRQREAQLLRLLDAEMTADDLTAALYVGIDPRLIFAARRNVESHLKKLRDEDRIYQVGDLDGQPLYRRVGSHNHAG